MGSFTRDPTGLDASSGTWSSTDYTIVNDYPDTADAVSTGTTGAYVTWTISTPTVPTGATNISVKISMYADRDTPSGLPSTLAERIKVGSNYYNAANNTLTNSPALYENEWTTNPATGSSWTVSEANSIAAIGVYSSDASPTVYCFSVRLTITYTDPFVSITLDTAVLTTTGQAITVDEGTPSPISVALDTATLLISGQKVTVSASSAPQTITLDTAIITVSGQIIDVNAPIQVTVDTALLSLSGQKLYINAPISISLDTLLLNITGQNINIDAPINITLDTASLIVSGQNLSVNAPISVSLDTITLSISGQGISVIAGSAPQTILLDTALLSLAGQSIRVIYNVIIQTATALLTLYGQNLSVSAGFASQTIEFKTALLSAVSQNLNLIPGATAVVLDTATITFYADDIVLSLTVILHPSADTILCSWTD